MLTSSLSFSQRPSLSQQEGRKLPGKPATNTKLEERLPGTRLRPLPRPAELWELGTGTREGREGPQAEIWGGAVLPGENARVWQEGHWVPGVSEASPNSQDEMATCHTLLTLLK